MAHRVAAGLTYADWGPADADTTVLALHGLTSTSEVWRPMADALPHARVVAPDLPGRGGSVDHPAPHGLNGHAGAVLALADELGLHEVVLIGHSMGAFLAPVVADRLGDRVRKVVLVDGGVAPERSLLIRRPVVRVLFSVQMRVLGRTWRSPEQFVDSIEGRAVRHRPELRPALIDGARHALAGEPGRLHVQMDPKRCVHDATETLTGDGTLGLLAARDTPVHLIAAAHGADDTKAAFLSDAAIALGRQQLPRLTTERLDANHLTMLFDARLPAEAAKP